MAFTDRLHNRGSISTGYDIEHSFVQKTDSTRTVEVIYGGFSGSEPVTRKGTVSFWFKWGSTNGGAAVWKLLNVYNSQVSIMPEGGTYDSSIYIAVYNEAVLKLVSNAKFRDTSAWYHICAVFDTTLSTASDRVKVYINGVRITDWSTANYPAQNADLLLVKENTKHFCGHNVNSGKPDGYYAEMYYIHDQAKDITDFGEFDDSGIWKPIEYTGTFGSYGYHWNFSNPSNLAEDQSGNDASTGQMTCLAANVTSAHQSVDTPTNNFCTLNYNNKCADTIISDGATNCDRTNNAQNTVRGTYHLSRGKWYYEVAVYRGTVNANYPFVGWTGNNDLNPCVWNYQENKTWVISGSGSVVDVSTTRHTGTAAAQDPSYSIYGIAFDIDNQQILWHTNGTYNNSGNPISVASATNQAIVTEEVPMTPSLFMFTGANQSFNFGGYSVITPSSVETDANGYGKFEYPVPSGYYAICSKNVAQYG